MKTALSFIVIPRRCDFLKGHETLEYQIPPLMKSIFESAFNLLTQKIKSPITGADTSKGLYWSVNMTLRSCSVICWGYEYEYMSLATSDKGFFALPRCHWPSIRAELGT